MKVKIATLIIGILLSIAGFWIVWDAVGFQTVGGIFLILWGENVTRNLKGK